MSFKERMLFAWQYLRNYRNPLGILILSVVLLAVLESTVPFLLGQMINSVQGKKVIWDLSLQSMALVTFGIFTFGLIFYRVNGYYSEVLEHKTQQDLALDLSDHVLDLPIDYHYKQKSGAIHQIVQRASDAISTIFRFLIYGFFPLLLQMIIALIIMYFNNWQIATLLLLTVIIYFTLIFNFRLKDIVENQREVNESYKKVFGDLGDSIANIFAVKANNGEEQDTQSFQQSWDMLYQRVKKNKWILIQRGLLESSLMRYSRLLILLYSIYLLKQQEITAGDLVMLVSYFGMVIFPLQTLANDMNNIRQRSVNLEDAAQLRQMEKEKDNPDARDVELHGGIEFRNVAFTYPDREGDILRNISFKLKAGKILAIFGETGSGKTTIYNLILRLYNHIQGQILFDGLDANSINRHCIRRQMAVVPQDPILFNESILFNIRYGKPDATFDEVMAASRLANAHDFIEALPKGYYTEVGERGVKLSGGQVQRLAIARAFLRNPKIMLLDEATSSLDAQTKFEVLSALRQLIAGRTAVIISHDFSAITMSADQIIVMDNGKISQTGTHEELIAKPGVYLNFWQKEQELRQKLEQI
ncbi:MAG: ABC transporter ATP-binding protein [Candidatus Parcubacteria bacterium]|nr:ABC transporter ATP-binding protein [Candidatus Parcubacteria bacterium]